MCYFDDTFKGESLQSNPSPVLVLVTTTFHEDVNKNILATSISNYQILETSWQCYM